MSITAVRLPRHVELADAQQLVSTFLSPWVFRENRLYLQVQDSIVTSARFGALKKHPLAGVRDRREIITVRGQSYEREGDGGVNILEDESHRIALFQK
jgi:hypothetical protein